MKRVAIIGLPGSGKSTLAMHMGNLLGLPVYHLDSYMFEGKKKREKKEFLQRKEAILSKEAWIIEGCSFSTLERRFATADVVIYLDFPRWLCLWRIGKRLLSDSTHLDKTGCLQGLNWPLIAYIWNFTRDKKAAIVALSRKYPAVEFLTFSTPKALSSYLDTLLK